MGNYDGNLTYVENIGTFTAPAFVERALGGVLGIVSSRSAPALADIDGDGDMDLVVGNYDGKLNYMENTGTSTTPAFVARTGSENPFDGIDVGGYSAPAVADLDGDGTLRRCP